MHSTSRCARLIFTWCPRQGWELHPRTTRGGGRARPPLPMLSPPPRVQIPLHPTPPRTPRLSWVPSFIPAVLSIPLPSHGATGAPRDPPIPAAERDVSRESGFYSHCLCCSLSRLLTTFSTQNFPVINIPAHGRKLCFSYTSPLLLSEPLPAARIPCASPRLFLPAPLRYFRHATKSAAAQGP